MTPIQIVAWIIIGLICFAFFPALTLAVIFLYAGMPILAFIFFVAAIIHGIIRIEAIFND